MNEYRDSDRVASRVPDGDYTPIDKDAPMPTSDSGISLAIAEDLVLDRAVATFRQAPGSRVRLIGIHSDSYHNGQNLVFHVRYTEGRRKGRCDVAAYDDLEILPCRKRSPGFRNTEGKGVSIRFANNYEISIQWGPRNYCSNQSMDRAGRTEQDWYRDVGSDGCANAEVYVYDPDGDPVWESPKEYQTPNEVLALMNEVANLR